MTGSFVESSFVKGDEEFEATLRPQCLADFTGQEPILNRLDVFIGAARIREETLGHCLFSGPPGLGKTTLASILPKAMGTDFFVTSGPLLEKPGDLAGLLTNLKKGDVLFIDEIHRLNRSVEEYLYTAMEDFVLDLVLDSGPNARTVRVPLQPFTLAGATTRLGLLTAPLRSRFALTCRLEYYNKMTLAKIVQRTARMINVSIDEMAAIEIASRARGTPRIANNLLRWARDFAAMRADGKITRDVAEKALEMLSIDETGLDEIDKKILSVLVHQFEGKPVGLSTLAVAVGEEKHTLEEVHEPFLIMQGFLKRTPRGREATSLAFSYVQSTLGS